MSTIPIDDPAPPSSNGRTEPSNNLVAIALGRKRRASQRLREAMQQIEQDIEQHDGIYPFNKGRLDQNEVCRRAGVHNTTLQRETHKHTTRVEVQDWLKVVRRKLATGKKQVRRAVTDKIDQWKAAYHAIAQNYHEVELELAGLKAEATNLRQRLREQEAEIVRLRRRTLVAQSPEESPHQ